MSSVCARAARGSGPCVSSIVSTAPLGRRSRTRSSRARRARRSTTERSPRGSRRASTSTPSLPAISSSVGARCNFAPSSAIARLICRAPACNHRPRHPVHRAELVDDRALDAGDRVRLELDVALGVVALDRADQAQEPVRDEITLVDVRRQAASSRPATYLTSGAYVRISRSRTALSSFDLRNSCQRPEVSSVCATA